MMRAEVQIAWKTQAGHRHQVEGLENEDAVFVTQEHPLFDAVLMVADGMGGHPRPREASQTAVQSAVEVLAGVSPRPPLPGAEEVLAGAVERAHENVSQLRTKASKPPGTTLSLALVTGDRLFIGHVGDGSVYLYRNGEVRCIAGGESLRSGNRPAQYLGQLAPLEADFHSFTVQPGDRVLLCTDGLTRYFGEVGSEALAQVLGRRGVSMQTIAGQLTAHSRPDEYDDDTTVALLEVTCLEEAPRKSSPPPPASAGATSRKIGKEPSMTALSASTGQKSGTSVGGVLLGGVLAALLLGGGFAAGFLLGQNRGVPAAPTKPGTSTQPSTKAPPEELSSLPSGNLVLLDPLGNRVFSISTRGGAPPAEPVALQALRVGTNGRLTQAGQFQLDPARGQITDPDGHIFPVEISGSQIRILRGGTLNVTSHPAGAAVEIDGRASGKSPQKLRLVAGRHHLRVTGKNWVNESDVDVVPGHSVTVSVGAP